MTAAKPPERIVMYKRDTGALHADCPHRKGPVVYLSEAAVERREKALREALTSALELLETLADAADAYARAKAEETKR